MGLQAGAKSSDVVLFMQTPQAEEMLKKGKVTLGADASVTAGNYDTKWDSTGSNIVAYQRSEGGMAGISLSGFTLSKDDTMNRNYYGRSVDYVALLENRAGVPINNEINSLIGEFPTGPLKS